jgi:hypothetical protein
VDTLQFLLSVVAGIGVSVVGLWCVGIMAALGWILVRSAVRYSGRVPALLRVVWVAALACCVVALVVAVAMCHAWVVGLVTSTDLLLAEAGQILSHTLGYLILGVPVLVMLSVCSYRYDRVAG